MAYQLTPLERTRTGPLGEAIIGRVGVRGGSGRSVSRCPATRVTRWNHTAWASRLFSEARIDANSDADDGGAWPMKI
jgi:hypothetical protein